MILKTPQKSIISYPLHYWYCGLMYESITWGRDASQSVLLSPWSDPSSNRYTTQSAPVPARNGRGTHTPRVCNYRAMQLWCCRRIPPDRLLWITFSTGWVRFAARNFCSTCANCCNCCSWTWVLFGQFWALIIINPPSIKLGIWITTLP